MGVQAERRGGVGGPAFLLRPFKAPLLRSCPATCPCLPAASMAGVLASTARAGWRLPLAPAAEPPHWSSQSPPLRPRHAAPARARRGGLHPQPVAPRPVVRPGHGAAACGAGAAAARGGRAGVLLLPRRPRASMASSSPSPAMLASRRGWQDDGWQERALVRAAWGPGTAAPKRGSARARARRRRLPLLHAARPGARRSSAPPAMQPAGSGTPPAAPPRLPPPAWLLKLGSSCFLPRTGAPSRSGVRGCGRTEQAADGGGGAGGVRPGEAGGRGREEGRGRG